MQRRSNQPLRIVVFAIISIVVIAAVALSVLNFLLLPRLIDRLDRTVERTCACAIDVGSGRFWPLQGFSITDIRASWSASNRYGRSPGDAVPNSVVSSIRLRIDSVRIRLPPASILRIVRGVESPPTEPVPTANAGAVFAALDRVVQVFPSRLAVTKLALDVDISDRPNMSAQAYRIDIYHNAMEQNIVATVAEDDRNTLIGNIAVDYAADTATGTVRIRPIAITPRPIEDGTFALDLQVAAAGSLPIEIAGSLDARNVSLRIPAIADELVRNLDVTYTFDAMLDDGSVAANDRDDSDVGTRPKDGGLLVRTGELRINGVAMNVVPAYQGFANGPASLSLSARLPATPVQKIIEAIPAAISGEISRTKTDGTLSWFLDLEVPMDRISDMGWNGEAVLSDDFAVTSIDRSVNVYKLNRAFTHTITDDTIGYEKTVLLPAARPASVEWLLLHSEHTEAQIAAWRAENRAIRQTRPEVPAPPLDSRPDPNYHYVYVDNISPWVIRSTLTAEDGDFFWYGGVNWVTLADAVELNFEARDIVIGASTISMQLIKMLFLEQTRIFSRKLQEVFLVYLLEHEVPVSKERILELYLNLVEYGPGLYGIFDASWHYFDKHPRDLTAGEATWLASILPSPKTYYQYYEDGVISYEWFRRMQRLYRIMLERGRMTRAEYNEAMKGPPQFVLR